MAGQPLLPGVFAGNLGQSNSFRKPYLGWIRNRYFHQFFNRVDFKTQCITSELMQPMPAEPLTGMIFHLPHYAVFFPCRSLRALPIRLSRPAGRRLTIRATVRFGPFGVITGQTPLPALTGNYAFLNSRAYGTGNSQNADLVTPTIDMTGFTNVTCSSIIISDLPQDHPVPFPIAINSGSTWTVIQTFTSTTANPQLLAR